MENAVNIKEGELNRVAADGISKRLMDLRTGRNPVDANAKPGLFDCGGALSFNCKQGAQVRDTKTNGDVAQAVSVPEKSTGINQVGGARSPSANAPEKPEIKDTLPEPMNRELVRAIQIALRERGFYRSAIDGVFGNGTRTAISDYQRAMRVPISGQPTRALLLDIQKR